MYARLHIDKRRSAAGSINVLVFVREVELANLLCILLAEVLVPVAVAGGGDRGGHDADRTVELALAAGGGGHGRAGADTGLALLADDLLGVAGPVRRAHPVAEVACNTHALA